ncbi:MAG: riboflavin biosynthesis protein RibF [Synergistaceae bacterium]|jgi:riboflavin kinase/FMN adenylyltransferase|nr:riboflavin biosynthesis protein RibF [Synergistaceae bacterium]
MIAAIGAFDGFHRGHQELLKRAAAGGKWGVVTFSSHPDVVLGSGDFKALFTIREQSALEKFFSVPEVRRINFTRETADMAPSDFLNLISREFGVTGVVVGEDFRFGRNRSGTCELLRNECAGRGWSVEIVPDLSTDDRALISSTAIRRAVALGEMRRAWEMLGYPFFYMSGVVRGKGRGRALGFPTANVELVSEKIEPAGGVYATLVSVGGKLRAGAANIGKNPTFGDVERTSFEINLTDYRGDLYGKDLSIFLLDFIRPERRFENTGDLAEQIARDANIAAQAAEDALLLHKPLFEKLEAVRPQV